MLQLDSLNEALTMLGGVLSRRGVSYALVVAGVSSMLLLRLIERPTADLDVLGFVSHERYVKAEALPEPLARAAAEVVKCRPILLARLWTSRRLPRASYSSAIWRT